MNQIHPKSTNIAYEISPLLNASGTLGNKSGVYRYMMGLLQELVKQSEVRNNKILLFSFHKDLFHLPLGREIHALLKHPNVMFVRSKKDFFKEVDISYLNWGIFHKLSKKIPLLPHVLDKQRHLKQTKAYNNFLINEFKKYGVTHVFNSQTGFSHLEGFTEIITIYDLTPDLMPNFHQNETVYIHQRLIKFAYNHCNIINCISESTKSDLLHIFPKFKSKYILVGYPGLNDFSSDNSHSPNFLPDLKIEPQKYLLYYGTFDPRKNIEYFVSAFTDLIDNQSIPKEYKLVLVGGDGWGDVKRRIRDYIREKYQFLETKPVILLDYMNDEDLKVLIKNAYCTVYPSLYEGFGLPILESISFNTPVLTADNSSLPEAGGNAALYFDADNIIDIEEKIIQILTDKKLYTKLKKNTEAQTSKFSWGKTVSIIQYAISQNI